ncbi:MAG: thiamine pyrophosphate-dependent enzyme [Candidatus Methanofastidiosia archaeon]|jgi:pyruvate ferredoxin oxidoreductase beta subunit
MVSLKKLSEKPELLAPGHRLCAGCGASIIVRQVLLAAEHPVIIANATGCLEVATTIYPYTSWRVPFFHSAFENAAATIAGIETMYQVQKRKGNITKDIKFIAFGGDGGTYDIGVQALSGAIERGHDIMYLCYNNGAYMNTGIQRSSATPRGASTTTSPAGKVIPGKKRFPKDLTAIVAAHGIPYCAQTSPAFYNDVITKTQKALNTEGPTFLNVISPCPRGWRHGTGESIAMAEEAVTSCFWPVYEVDNGEWILTDYSKKIAEGKKEKTSVIDWMKKQGRFKHLFDGNHQDLLNTIQEKVDKDWENLIRKSGY